MLLSLPLAAVGAEPVEKIDFNLRIKPLLADRCFTCHGPDAENRQADLRLDIEQNAFAAVESGSGSHVIRPHDPSNSEVFLRITSTDDDARMPPADSNLSLTADEIELIRLWIEQGARWKQHWSFVPLKPVPVPIVGNKNWPKNEIDRFVLRRLEAEGIEPTPEADRETLIRRVSFDLTGLPPTIKEIDDFLRDESAGAYERLVDRLLTSERFGEHMAASWLDVARYSDTYGYQVDRDRHVWPWRDWVVRAFNENMPYSEFITQQLAGDLLPGATDDQTLATTFNRLHPQKVEGGSVPEEFRVEYVADRTQTFATAFLGLTLECARCHDHKYDPITQEEYYQFFAFFNNIDECGLYSYHTKAVPTPTLLLADDATKTKIADVEHRIAEAERELISIAERRRDAFSEWRASLVAASGDQDDSAADANTPKAEADPAGSEIIPGRIAHLDFENLDEGPNKSVSGQIGNAVRLTGDDGIGLEVGNFRRFQPFSVALWMNTPDEKERAVIYHRSKAWTDAGSRGYQLLLENGRLSASLIHFWPGNAARVRALKPVPTNRWIHVAVTYDGSSRAEGLRIFADGRPVASEVVRDNLFKNITGGGGDNITIGQRTRDRGFANGLVDDFQVFDRQLTSIEIAELHDGKSLSTLRSSSSEDVADEQDNAFYAYYLATADEPYRAQLSALQKVRAERSNIADPVQEIMVMHELPEPRPTFLLTRGAYDAPAEPVTAGTPATFGPFPADQPRNRLGLARWLTDRKHPLTARVAVNRFWQACFGRGLVRTPEDFGSQGMLATHPELLNWLAIGFIEHGWDVKRLLKKIVMSATYRQSSSVNPELLIRDPDNRLLARTSRYRLSAEMLRDNALAASQLLVNRIGGSPARPYEVAVSFKPVARDKDDGLYRRSLYTYWKRTGPAPVMMTLDASKRDVCRVRRERTSSPLQALVLMNGPQFSEASRQLSQRLIEQHRDNVDAIIIDMFRVLTSRRPADAEKVILRDLYRQQIAFFEQHPERADEFLKIGDAPLDASVTAPQLAATSILATTLFNFESCVMKR